MYLSIVKSDSFLIYKNGQDDHLWLFISDCSKASAVTANPITTQPDNKRLQRPPVRRTEYKSSIYTAAGAPAEPQTCECFSHCLAWSKVFRVCVLEQGRVCVCMDGWRLLSEEAGATTGSENISPAQYNIENPQHPLEKYIIYLPLIPRHVRPYISFLTFNLFTARG